MGFHFVAKSLWAAYHTITAEIEAGNFSGLPELHALSSGLKVLDN